MPRQTLLSATLLFGTLPALADDVNMYFDSATSGATWDNATTANWSLTSAGPYNSTIGVWNIANFEGTGAAVNSAGVNVNGIAFNTNGYTIQSGAVTFGSPSGGPAATVATGVSATITSDIGKAGGGTHLRKEGAGALTITGASVQLDSLTVNAGTFQFNGGTMAFGNGLNLGNTAVAGTGVFALDGGTVNVTGGNNIFSNNAAASSVFTQTGGTFNLTGGGYLYMGNQAAPVQTIAVSGGVFNAANTGAQYLAIRGNASITVSGTASATFNNLQIGHPSVGGAGTVNLDGGSLTLASMGRNNGTGTFNFNGGLLRASAASATYFQNLTRANVRNGGARIDTQAFNTTIAQVLAHSDVGGDAATDGGLTKSGAGILTLTSGANTYTGATTINEGTVDVRTAVGSLPSASAVTVAGGAALTHTLNGATIANSVSGGGTWTLNVVSGAINNFTLTGTNAGFTGALNIGAGARLIIGSGWTTAAGLPGATAVVQVANGGAVYHTAGSGSMSNPITINGDGVAEGAPGPYGALRVDGGSTYTGAVTLGGNARIGGAGGHGTLTGNVTIGAHTLTLNTSNSNLTFTGNLTSTAAGAVVKTGNFTTILGGDNSGLLGTVTVAQSNLFLNSATAASASAAWVVNLGNLANTLAGNPTYSLGSLGGTGGSLGNNVGGSAVTYSIGALGTDTTYAGNIVNTIGGGGTTAITKVGGGSLTLAGANSYTGNTLVSGGTLVISGSTATAGLIQVSSGATLGGGGSGGLATVADLGVLAPGHTGDNHLLLAELNLSGDAVLRFDLDAPLADPMSIVPDAASDHVATTGALMLDGKLRINALAGFGTPVSGNRWLLMTANGGVADGVLEVDTLNSPALSGGLSYLIDADSNPGYVYLAVVPEGGTATLFLLGLAALLRARKRR
jgi:fibronectin-binding autotransporter adhesin